MASYVYINGQELPIPKRGVKTIVTTVVDSGRNLDGVVVGQKIGRDQYKIDGLEWPYLTAEEWSRVLQLCSSFYFNVTFVNPVTRQWETKQMYCGDRSAEPYWVNDQVEPTNFINCKVNLIDTGR